MTAQYTKYNIQNTSAYTLIEILVTLTIIGILFTVGYANFRSFSQRQGVLNVAKSLQGDLRLAQQKALSGEKPNDARCTSPNRLNGYGVVFNASGYTVEADCNGVMVSVKDVAFTSDISIVSPFPSPNPIIFKVLGNGTNIDTSTSITISQAGTTNKTSVVIDSGGNIQ